MIIRPKSRGFICLTAHPKGCEENVSEQIEYVKKNVGKIDGLPKNVLIIGGSTGYGLASRVVLAFSGGANTINVSFGRPAVNGRPASAGRYNSCAFKKFAENDGLIAENVFGDAFSNDVKSEVLNVIRRKFGKIDCVVYSLASPKRMDQVTGDVYKSVIKPIGGVFRSKTVNVDTEEIIDVAIDPATDDEVAATVKVMGGEDWELWIHALHDAGLLAEGVKTVAYSYVGLELTWPIYANGTVGAAKNDLIRARDAINSEIRSIGGQAVISVNKAVVTQASAAIPVVPLYLSVLMKVMKEKNVNEGCIEQMTRLFTQKIRWKDGSIDADKYGNIRLDEFELSGDVTNEVKMIWPTICTENIRDVTDIRGYKEEFLKLFGFGVANVDYDAEVEP